MGRTDADARKTRPLYVRLKIDFAKPSSTGGMDSPRNRPDMRIMSRKASPNGKYSPGTNQVVNFRLIPPYFHHSFFSLWNWRLTRMAYTEPPCHYCIFSWDAHTPLHSMPMSSWDQGCTNVKRKEQKLVTANPSIDHLGPTRLTT